MFESTTTIQPTTPPKSPIIAAVLSLVISGVGQMYLGQVKKGIIILVATIVLSCTIIGGIAMWILGIIDAYQIATKLAEGRPVGDMEWFWQSS
jgi:TM2 domain-containing membrane protein YozV